MYCIDNITQNFDIFIPVAQYKLKRGDYITAYIGEKLDFLQPFKGQYIVKFGDYYGLVPLKDAEYEIEQLLSGRDEEIMFLNIVNKYK